MQAKAIVNAPPSRPKIHRLPGVPAARREQAVSRHHSMLGLGLLAALTLVAFASDQLVQHSSAKASGQALGQLPLPTDNDGLKLQSQTILLTGENEGIIGQLARIPTQTQQMTEIKTISEVDNKAGRELLGIISKY